jgi:hypothetical protein
VTVVTGFWKVNGKHSMKHYLEWFKNTLTINSSMIFFYSDENFRCLVSKLRHELPTHFIRLSLSDFEGTKYLMKNWTHPEHVPSTSLGLIWIEKVVLIDKARRLNIYDTDWFAWIDAGNAYYRYQKIPSMVWPSITNIDILPLDKIIYTDIDNWRGFGGTAFLYHRNITSFVKLEFWKHLQVCKSTFNDWRCLSDQIIFSLMRSQFPDLFLSIGQGYGSVVPILFNSTAVIKQNYITIV